MQPLIDSRRDGDVVLLRAQGVENRIDKAFLDAYGDAIDE
jgi:hypothetical protein